MKVYLGLDSNWGLLEEEGEQKQREMNWVIWKQRIEEIMRVYMHVCSIDWGLTETKGNGCNEKKGLFTGQLQYLFCYWAIVIIGPETKENSLFKLVG